MGKSFKGFSKALSLILAVAMVVTCVPTSAYAAELLSVDESEDLLISNDAVAEESSDALVTDDASASEENSSTSIDTQTASAPSDDADENTAGEEDILPDGTGVDRTLTIVNTGKTTSGDPGVLAYDYGVAPADAIFTAKKNEGSGAVDFTDATVTLYKVNVDVDTWNTSTHTKAASITAADTAFDTFRTCQATYAANMTDDTAKTNYEAALKTITDKTAYLTPVTAPGTGILPGRMTFSVTDGVLKFHSDKALNEVYDEYYVILVEDKTANRNPDNLPIYSPLFHINVHGAYKDALPSNKGNNDVTFKISTFEVTTTTALTDTTANVINKVGTSETPKKLDKATNSKYTGTGADALTVITFDAADMNYAVYDKVSDATTAGKTPGDVDNVIAQTITISADDKVSTALDTTIDDLTYTLTDVNGNLKNASNVSFTDWFSVVPSATTLNSNTSVNLTVAPKPGLKAGAGAADETYEAYLHVSSAKTFEDEYIVKLLFTVSNDLVFDVENEDGDVDLTTGILGDLGSDEKGTSWLSSPYSEAQPVGSANNPIIIAEKNIGTSFDDVIISAAGGSGTLSVTTATSADNTKLKNLGLKGELAESEGVASLKITGALVQSAYVDYATLANDTDKKAAITANEFKVTATDGNSSEDMYFIIVPDEVDTDNIVVKAGTNTLKYGTGTTFANNSYTWQMDKPDAGETEANIKKAVEASTATLTIENKSAVKLAFDTFTSATVAGTAGNYIDFNYDPAAASTIEINAGETATITVKPKRWVASTYANESTQAGNESKANVTFGGTGLDATQVGLAFNIAADTLVITKPAATRTVLPEAEVGVAYEKGNGYQFEYSKSSDTNVPSWDITAIDAYEPITPTTTNPKTEGLFEKATDTDGIRGTWTVTNDTTVTTGKKYYKKTTLDSAKMASFASDYGISLAPTGLLSGTAKKEASFDITVQATAATAGVGINKTTVVCLDLINPTIASGVEVKNGTVDVKTTKSIDMGKVKVDAKDGKEAEVSIKNLLGIDLKGVKAELVDTNATDATLVDGTTTTNIGTTIGNYFKLVFSEDDVLNALYANGFTVKAGETNTFKIVSKPSAAMVKGTYNFKVQLSGGCFSGDPLVIATKLVVEDTPIITANPGSYLVTGATTATAFTAASEFFSVTYGATTYNYDFTVADVAGSDMTIAESGLTFTSNKTKFEVTGTPKRAGTLKVAVTATAQVDSSITTTKEFEINITGAVAITATINGTSVTTDDVYVLTGLAKGDDASTAALVLSNATGTDAKGLRITVSDAEDDRLASVRDASGISDIYKNAGSSSVITVTEPSLKTIAASGGTVSTAINATAAKEGEYKVKVSVTGENIAKVQFYVYLVVSPKLTIEAPESVSMTVGAKSHIEARAIGTDRDITWTEVNNAKTDGTELNTTNDANATTGSNIRKIFGTTNNQYAAITKTTSLASLTSQPGAVNAPLKAGITNDTTTVIRSLVINGAGGLTLKEARTTKVTKDDTLVGYTIDEYNDQAPVANGTYKIYLRANAAAEALDVTKHEDSTGSNYKNTSTAIVAQKAYATITVNVGKSSAVNVKNVSSDPASSEATEYDYKTGIKGTVNGVVPSNVEEYTFKEVTEGYTPSSSAIHVGIFNDSATKLSNAKLTIDNDKFVIANGDTITYDSDEQKASAFSGNGTVATPYQVDLDAEKVSYVKITPKQLTAGTHEATLTITHGDLAAPVTMKLKFVVAAKSYLLNADFVADIDATATNFKTDLKDENKLTTAATNSVATAAGITLTPFAEGTAPGAVPVNDDLYYWNGGNTELAIGAISIEEVADANGTKILTTDGYKLKIALGAGGFDTAKITNAAALAVPTKDATGKITNYNEQYIRVQPIQGTGSDALEVGDYTAYLKVSIKDATPSSFIVPVHYVVYSKNLTNITSTPATGGTIALKGVSEGYKSEDATGGEYTIKNNSTVGAKEGLYNVNITLSDGTHFKVVPEDKDNITGAGTTYTIKKIDAGETIKFKVVPVEGFPEGSYQTNVTISGGNLASSAAVQNKFTLEVAKSMAFTMNAYSAASVAGKVVVPESINATLAQRLFTSLGTLSTAADNATNYNATFDGSTNATKEVSLDVDKNGTADTSIVFTGSSAFTAGYVAGDVAKVTNVIAKRVDGQKLPNASYTVSGIETTTGFTSVTLNEYSVITLMADRDTEFINGEVGKFEKDNKKVIVVGNIGTDPYNTDKLITGAAVATTYTGFNDTAANASTAADDAIKVLVPNGSTAASVFANGLPTAKVLDESLAFEAWESSVGNKSVDNSTKVNIDDVYEIHWHGHEYPGSVEGDTDYVKWNWSSDYRQATVTVKCVKAGCSHTVTLDSAKGEITITDTKKDADCENGERHEYKAETLASKMPNGAVYTSIVKSDEDKSTIKGHKYRPTVTWTYSDENKTYEPTISLVCTVCKETDKMQHRTETVSGNAITFTKEEKKATCTEKGSAKYSITGFTAVGKSYTPADFAEYTTVEWIKEAELPATGHNKTPDLTVENFNEDTLKGTVTAKCPDCGAVVFGPAELSATKNTDGTYKFSFTGTDGKEYSVDWSNHEHKWGAPSWAWASKDSATATFTCSVGKETKNVTATIVAVKTNTNGNTQYKATVTGPDGKEYSDLKWYDKNGNPTSGGGISIEGLEEEYKFTGTAIKPVITVEDNDLGITLAEGVDYKLSFKDNTKLGTATITVNGKGNYQGKTVTGQFKIVSPTDGITAELAGSVKKIAKISESFVYDGEAKYPATITVTTTDGDIVYQHSSGDTYTTENAKEVALSFANNVNAGSATVAATGKDGKTKKTTFKITKVDLSAAGDKLEIAANDAAWAVKGAVPEVTVTYTPEGGSAITLVNGKDYKVDVNYAAKKNAATGNTVKITGKGTNFTKSAVSGAFEIEKYALSDASIVSVGAYAGVAPKAIKAIVVDGNGVIIPAKQYTLKIEKDSEDITTSKTKLVAGDAITVTVTAVEGGNLDGSGSVDVTIAPDLNKAKVVLSDTLKKNGVEYTGAPIDLESYGDDSKNFFEDGITVQLKNASKTLETLEYGTDFEVAGYQNNIKKGTMTVYIRGISEKCSGTKAFKVKISAKTMKKAE